MTSGSNRSGGSSDDRTWQRGYEKLGWADKTIINELADKQFQGNRVEAMKRRCKGDVTKALLGYLPNPAKIYSAEERMELQKLSHDSKLHALIRDLTAGADAIDDDTPIPPTAKNSAPKKT